MWLGQVPQASKLAANQDGHNKGYWGWTAEERDRWKHVERGPLDSSPWKLH